MLSNSPLNNNSKDLIQNGATTTLATPASESLIMTPPLL